MQKCNKCGIKIEGGLTHCPLCKRTLEEGGQETPVFAENVETGTRSYHQVKKMIHFLAITIIVLSIVLNTVVPIKSIWIVAIVGTALCLWMSVLVAIKKHKNILKYMLYQACIIQIFGMYLDYKTGGIGWSITYVLPILCITLIVVMYALSKLLKLDTGDYMIYLLIDIVIGFIPLLCIKWRLVQNEWPSIACLSISIVFLIALLVFEGQSIYAELKRRLHV